MLNNLRKILFCFRKEEYSFFGKGTPKLKFFFSILLRIKNYGIKTLIQQKNYYSKKEKKIHTFLKDNGYLVFKKIDNKKALIDKINPQIKKIKITAKNNKYPLNILDIDRNNENKVIFDFGLTNQIKNIVMSYFQSPTVLQRVELWYSPNSNNVEYSSQMYHFDNQDDKSLLYIVPLTIVDKNSGPFTFLDANQSLEIIESHFGKYAIMPSNRIDEKLIKSTSYDKIKEIQLVSSLGEAFIVDGDRCLHYGSRKATKSRSMLVFHYLRETNFNSYRSKYLEVITK